MEMAEFLLVSVLRGICRAEPCFRAKIESTVNQAQEKMCTLGGGFASNSLHFRSILSPDYEWSQTEMTFQLIP